MQGLKSQEESLASHTLLYGWVVVDTLFAVEHTTDL